ncbi:MAG: FGGY family carbohydrate kinase, partial [Roseiarcus sp.]
MRCVLGLDIGTTSTIGVLIRPPDQTLALASRPVALRSDHVGWAEEDPEQWWANVGEIVRELMRSSGASPADVAVVGVTGMLPAMVLLDGAGRLLRPSIQQSDARCGAEVDELRAEVDEKAFLAKAGNGINQQLVAAKLRWIERHEPEVFARISTVFGSYDYVNWRLTAERAVEQNWALEAGFVDLRTHEIDDALVALAHIPRAALPRKIASHEILGVVSDRGAAESGLEPGTPV